MFFLFSKWNEIAFCSHIISISHIYVDSINLKRKQMKRNFINRHMCIGSAVSKTCYSMPYEMVQHATFFFALNGIYFLILYLLPFRLCLIMDNIYSIYLSFNAKISMNKTCVKGRGYWNLQIIFFDYLQITKIYQSVNKIKELFADFDNANNHGLRQSSEWRKWINCMLIDFDYWKYAANEIFYQHKKKNTWQRYVRRMLFQEMQRCGNIL